jgi:hypothetical protein
MKKITAIHGKTLRDKIRSDKLQQLSGIQDIVKWANVRRREWDVHLNRMEDNRLAKIARDNRPQGVRSSRQSEENTERESQYISLALKSGEQASAYIEEEEEEEEEYYTESFVTYFGLHPFSITRILQI